MLPGRDAVSGESLRLDSACIEANDAIVIGWIADSVPPAMTTSARPSRRCSTALTIDSVLEAHALATVRAYARAPKCSERLPAAALGMSIGTVMGMTRRGPFSRSVSHASSSVHTPPMPVAKSTPRRSGSTSGLPASAHASMAATSANCDEGSRRLAIGRSRTVSGRTAACAAKVTGSWYCSTQSYSSVRAPEAPSSNADQLSGAVPPMGLEAPMPVTTIRGMLMVSSDAPVGA